MANYDFNNCLSPERFQDLGRDLIQLKYEKYAESFKKVKDDGIDFRIKNNNVHIYGQVKRYSSFYNLKYNLKNEELKKIKKLNPEQYILITSLDYTPKQKKEIMEILEGYIKDEEDIIGRTDINNLLSMDKYKSLQRKYYELWMDSLEIMKELIDDSMDKHIYNISKEKLREAMNNEKTYIESEISREAEEILENNNCVLITGEAGIGKTSLAYHLACKTLQNSNTKFICVYSPEEILRTCKEDENQTFILDDFWGSVFENSYEKREEKKFIDVVNMIKNSEGKKLILTTRDYILEEGLKKHPKVYDELLEDRIILKLKEFSELLKVKILFKHLETSKLEWETVNEIARGYKYIVNHTMYNPRLIAEYIKEISKKPIMKKSYLKELLGYLDNPQKFIKEIFDEQTETVKIILILLLLMRREVQEKELKNLFYEYIEFANDNNIKKSDFFTSIKNIDGSLIKIYRDEMFDDEVIINIDFQNPSIEEFVYQYLKKNLYDYANNIIGSTNNLNLISSLSGVFLLAIDHRKMLDDIDTGHKLIAKDITENLVNKLIQSYDKLIYWYQKDIMDSQFTEGYSELDRLELIIRINKELQSYPLRCFIQEKIDKIFDGLVKKERFFTYDDMGQVLPLIEVIQENSYEIKYQPLEIINGYYTNIKFSYQYKILDEFSEIYPNVYSKFLKENLNNIKSHILNLIVEDVEFYEYELMTDDLSYFIEVDLPRILKIYNMKLPKWIKYEIEDITGYIWWKPKKEIKKRNRKVKKINNERKAKRRKIKEKEDKVEELIEIELVNLLGENKDKIIKDKKSLIFEKIKDKKLSQQIYNDISKIKEISTPCSIISLRFFKRVLTFINKKNKTYFSFNEFMDEFLDYSLGSINNKKEIKEKLEQFCYEICMNNKFIWRETEIKEHPIFEDNPELVDFLIKRKILDRNKIWIEFYNELIIWYLGILYSIKINEDVTKFTYKLRDAESLVDKECFFILIYESIMPEKINRELIEKEIKNYIKEIEGKDRQIIIKNIIKSSCYDLTLDSKLNIDGESYCCPFAFNILEYMGYHFELYIPETIYEMKENLEDFKLLKEKFYVNNKFEINFGKCIKDKEIVGLFERYGVWDEIYNIYKKCIEILNYLEEKNYQLDIRLYNK